MTPRHLSLVVDNTRGYAVVADAMTTSTVSVHRLAARIVAAAQRWAIEMERTGLPLDFDADEDDSSTDEQRAQRDLMDAVYDLEFHQSMPGARPDHHDVC